MLLCGKARSFYEVSRTALLCSLLGVEGVIILALAPPSLGSIYLVPGYRRAAQVLHSHLDIATFLNWGTRLALKRLEMTPRVLVPEAINHQDQLVHSTRGPRVSMTVRFTSPTIVSLRGVHYCCRTVPRSRPGSIISLLTLVFSAVSGNFLTSHRLKRTTGSRRKGAGLSRITLAGFSVGFSPVGFRDA